MSAHIKHILLALIAFGGIVGCAARKPVAPVTQLERDYYGKPYLDAPKGYHWICPPEFPYSGSNYCYIVPDK